jgi:predicted enzyme related to lactoylglutathione lyase
VKKFKQSTKFYTKQFRSKNIRAEAMGMKSAFFPADMNKEWRRR